MTSRRGTRKHSKARRLPSVLVIDATEIDADGDLLGRPASWRHAGDPPVIFIQPSSSVAAPGVGDRLLSRLDRQDDGTYTARPMHRITATGSGRGATAIIGRFRAPRPAVGGFIEPISRGRAKPYAVPAGATGGAADGDLIRAQVTKPHPRTPQAKVVEIIAPVGHPSTISLVAIHEAEIPTEFPDAALTQARAAEPPVVGDRIDLRDLPLVTIDGADARDFDDAVFAEPDGPNGKEGWHLVVAIADVAAYVPAGSELDQEAYRRGNSVYLPDMVVPMLPEELSNGLCSLRPNEDRACLAAHLWIDADGALLRHRFERALMCSTDRLTYDQAEQDRDNDPRLVALYGAFGALTRERHRRGCLELDLPERRFEVADDGTVTAIHTVTRLDSHRLIEEFMITANVAAALALQEHNQPGMFRVHDQPDPERVEELRRALTDTGLSLPPGQVPRPAMFNGVIDAVAGTPHGQLINTLILRCQAQALYSPNNTGHFGLALRHYAHFTSPIRRYADLVVHRALISALNLPDDGLADGAGNTESASLAAVGEHISMTERRAATAERSAKDRFAAAFLADRVGATFDAHISGVTRFGLFVTLIETGADGLVPMSRLPAADYVLDSAANALIDRHARRAYHLGDAHEVRLAEANGLTGSLLFDLLTGPSSPAPASGKRGSRPPKSRPPARGRRSRGRRK